MPNVANSKAPYKVRGRPEKNPNRLRAERAYKRGASKPGDRPNAPWRAAAGVRPHSNLKKVN